ISNGTIGALTDQGAGVFSFDITALANGTVTIDVAAGAATDAAGNSSQAATQFSIDAAFSAPVPVITSTEPNPTSSSIIPLTIDFGEVVTGFDVTKLVVSNATPGVLNDLGGGKYTINVIAIAEGPVTVDVAAAVAQNTSGVFNAAAVRFAITIIKTGPTPVITSLVTGPTGQLLIPVKIDFGGEVTSFDVADLLVFNATMGTLANLGGGLYSMDLLPGSDGVVTVDIGAGAAFDLLNNKSQAAVQFAIDVDVTSPKPILSTTLADPTSSALIPVTIDFGEVVSGFDATDLVLSNGTVGLAFDLGGGVFSADITATGDGPVTINLPGNIALDAVGNNSLAADQLAIIVDRKGPVPVITSTEVSPTTAMTIPLTIDFGEVVTGFDGSDLIITNAVAGSLWDQGNGKFGLDITAEKRGPVTVNIGGGAASDLVGNASVAMDAPFTIAFDPILGLAEDEFKQALNIYPNPGRGVFYMNFDPAVFKSDVLIKVIGVNGAEIKSMHIEPHQFNRFMLDMSSFGPGLYIANIMNNQGQVITRKKIQVIN
ncbi:MAG: Ig-like domain-containing protein, partial [Cyclobacteriaceae bacterium]|nr:Ig-like domain-containing protein [Cyclobacteriaceae bacterium]